MNIQAYIESGILEAYALGALTEKERAEVIALCDQYPEVRYELRELEFLLENAVFNPPVAAPAYVKEDIWATLENLNREKEISLDNLPAHQSILRSPAMERAGTTLHS